MWVRSICEVYKGCFFQILFVFFSMRMLSVSKSVPKLKVSYNKVNKNRYFYTNNIFLLNCKNSSKSTHDLGRFIVFNTGTEERIILIHFSVEEYNG